MKKKVGEQLLSRQMKYGETHIDDRSQWFDLLELERETEISLKYKFCGHQRMIRPSALTH